MGCIGKLINQFQIIITNRNPFWYSLFQSVFVPVSASILFLNFDIPQRGWHHVLCHTPKDPWNSYHSVWGGLGDEGICAENGRRAIQRVWWLEGGSTVTTSDPPVSGINYTKCRLWVFCDLHTSFFCLNVTMVGGDGLASLGSEATHHFIEKVFHDLCIHLSK